MSHDPYQPSAPDERCEQLLREKARAQEPDPQFRTRLLQRVGSMHAAKPSALAGLLDFIQHGPRYLVVTAFLIVAAGAAYPMLKQQPVVPVETVTEQGVQRQATPAPAVAPNVEESAQEPTAALDEIPLDDEPTPSVTDDDFASFFEGNKDASSGFGSQQGGIAAKQAETVQTNAEEGDESCASETVCLCRSSINANTYYSCEYGSHIQTTTCDGVRTEERSVCPYGCARGACRTTPNAICGNRIVETGEDCDDGNIQSADGCSRHCRTETCQDPDTDDVSVRTNVEILNSLGTVIDRQRDTCFTDVDVKGLYPRSCYDKSGTRGNGSCLIEQTCDENIRSERLVVCPHGCENGTCVGGEGTLCGNGEREEGEECDDGNNLSEDGCSNLCRLEALPDLVIRSVQFQRDNVNLEEDRMTLTVVLANNGAAPYDGTVTVRLRTGGSDEYPDGFMAEHTQQHMIPSGSTIDHTLALRYILPPGASVDLPVQAVLRSDDMPEETTENNSIVTALQSSPVVQLCEDSDGGRDYAVQGSASATQGTITKARDRCRDAQELIEIYCRDGQIAATVRTCLHGCQDGACKDAPTNTGKTDLSLAPPIPNSTLISRGDTLRVTHAVSTDEGMAPTNTRLELTLPPSLIFDAKNSDLFCSPIGNALVCQDIPIMQFFTLSFTVAADAICPGSISYEASVMADQKEIRPEDNTQTIGIDLSCGAAIADVGVSFSLPGITEPGQEFTATATISNAGPDSIEDIVLNLVVPLDLTLDEERASADCTQYGTQINCSFLSVQKNDSRMIALPFTVGQSADCNVPQSGYATVSTTARDDFPENDESQRQFITIVCEE